MFAYCLNNPLVYTDSGGNRPIASTTVKAETEYERFISCNWMKGKADNPAEERYYAEKLIKKTSISQGNGE